MKDFNDIGEDQLSPIINGRHSDTTVAFRWSHPFLSPKEWIGNRIFPVMGRCHGHDMSRRDGPLSSQAGHSNI